MKKIIITPEIVQTIRAEAIEKLKERGETLNDLRKKKELTGWPVSFYSLWKLIKYPKQAEKLETTILRLLFVFGYHYENGIFKKHE